jgi:energy-coupling factor transporter transmembrane protein EcfT
MSGEGVLRRCGPLSLLGTSVLPLVGAPAIQDAWTGLVSVGVVVALAAPVLRDLRPTLFRLGLGLVAALSIGLTTWLYGGHDLDAALAAALRIVYFIVPAAVLTTYIEPSELGDHLAQRVRLPARVVVASVAAVQRLDGIADDWDQIRRARRARGLGPFGGPVHRGRVLASMALALLVSTLRTSGRMSVAMDARGFAGAHRRTWAEPAPWAVGDTLLLAVGVALAVLPWLVGPVLAA